MQVTQAAWDPHRSEWFDVFDDDRKAGDWGHWTGGAMTWNGRCAQFHSTGVVKGYDAATDTYEDLVKAGVIDPTKVARTALQNAASIAGLLLTTECVVVERKDEKPAMAGAGGGMGGMGGMY